MFEGAFSFWHIAILAFVIFIVVGPKMLQKQWNRAAQSVSQFVNGETAKPAPAPVKKRGLAYRLGRLFKRKKR